MLVWNDEIDIKRLDHCNEIHWWNTHTHDNRHHNGGAVCEITIIATMATKTMTSQGID